MRNRGNTNKNLVGFLLGGVRYAVGIHEVREIINPLEIVPLPRVPEGVIGVADFRGHVVPVLDLRARFQLPSRAPSRRTKWIVVAVDARPIGLVVDEVLGVFGDDSTSRETPSPASGSASREVAFVCKTSAGLTFVLDLRRVTASAYDLNISALDLRPLDERLLAGSATPSPANSETNYLSYPAKKPGS